MLRIDEVNKRSGSLKNLSFEVVDSITAIAKHKNNAFKIKATIPIVISKNPSEFAMPKGKNKDDPKAINIISLFADAHSIRASLLPEYSKIIAS